MIKYKSRKKIKDENRVVYDKNAKMTGTDCPWHPVFIK